MDRQALETRLKSFVAGKTKLLSEAQLTARTRIFSSGLLDSIAMVELVLFIERSVNIRLTPSTGATIQNLDSIERIIEAVAKAEAKRGVSG